MKKNQITIRVDSEVNDIVNEVMAEQECNKSQAFTHMAKSYKNNLKDLSFNQKLIHATFIADMETEINIVPKQYQKRLYQVMEEFKCQIL